MSKLLEQCINEGGIYKYEINSCDSSIVGIVISESRDDARKKVKSAYLMHGYSQSELENIIVLNARSGWFSDAPDVLEVYWD